MCIYTYISGYLSIYLPIYLPIYLSTYLSTYLSVFLSFFLSICFNTNDPDQQSDNEMVGTCWNPPTNYGQREMIRVFSGLGNPFSPALNGNNLWHCKTEVCSHISNLFEDLRSWMVGIKTAVSWDKKPWRFSMVRASTPCQT